MKTGSAAVLLRIIGGSLAGMAFGVVLAVLGGFSVGSGHGSDLPIRLAFVIDHPAGFVLWPATGAFLALRDRLWALLLATALLAVSVISGGLWVVRETGSLQVFPQIPDATIFSALGLTWFGLFELVAWFLLVEASFRRLLGRISQTRKTERTSN